MTGIAAMFAELAGADPFDVQVALEQVAARRRKYWSDRYRAIMADPVLREKHRARKRKHWSKYNRERRKVDPAFVEMRRRVARKSEQKRRAQRGKS